MQVSYNWLKEYIDPGVDAAELGRLYTAAGLELDEVVSRGRGLEGVVVARVLTCDPVAGSDHLHLCTVDAGSGAPLHIVCGAPNVAAGQLVACATVGATLPGGFTISEKKTMGLLSQGMLCSQKELGLADDHSGIWVLDGYFADGTAPIGMDIASALGLIDDVLVIELTPNRSDCLGMLNCAREAAALTGRPFTAPDLSYAEEGPAVAEEIEIQVEDPVLCPRYAARLVKGVRIAPSPLWMQNYLLAAGMRPINNVVDISNFVMLEMNQPLHTFDYQTLAGKQIRVRAARAGETMQTLDGKDRIFRGDEILICDAEKPICVAGVMGGMETEVTEATTDILIEAACFNPVSIRRASRRLGIPSEASMRFEKGVDVASCDLAARRAAQLLVKYCGGIADRGCVDVCAPKYANGFTERTISLRPARVNEILGTEFTAEEIAAVMRRLSFGLDELPGAMLVRIPSYRQDITLEIDLIEEVARLMGYDRIPQTLPLNESAGGRSERQKLLLRLKNLCVAQGLNETVNYSFISPRESDRLRLAGNHPWRDNLTITNPLSEEQSVMRQTLLPGLLNTTSRNQSRRNLDLRLFEIGNIFVPAAEAKAETQPEEVLTLGVVLAGGREAAWPQAAEEYDFYHMKGLLEAIFAELGTEPLTFDRANEEYLHPGRSAEVRLAGMRLGVLGELHPETAAAYELSGRVYVAELALPAALLSALAAGNRPHDLPKYPASTRDIAVIGSADIAAAAIENLIREAGAPYLRSVRLFDLYDKPPVPAGQRSLAYALQFRSDTGTLKDKEVDEAFERIVQALAENYDYRLR